MHVLVAQHLSTHPEHRGSLGRDPLSMRTVAHPLAQPTRNLSIPQHGGPDQEPRGHGFHSAKLLPALLVDGRIAHREDTTGCFPRARLIAVLACHIPIIRHGAHYAPPRAPSSSIGYR
ncbi:Uncharacterised protein [Mycobacteroides abscessus subsp. abscessus]|nr:Uncharacterised protein [Mycobacteroides abscessus subsp. abscessus]